MKRLSPTTTAGTVAALTLMAAQAPGIPHKLEIAFSVVGAIALGILGRYAQDCPPLCPGTDEAGRPNTPDHQKKRPPFILLPAAAAITVIFLIGCIAANPAHKAGDTTTPAYIVSPALAATSNSVVPLAQAAGPVTGTGPLLGDTVAGAFGLLALLSGAWARHKSQVAAALAEGVVAAGPAAIRTALDVASGTTKFGAVSTLINDATPATISAPQPPTK
jgi:hypothetical protein